MFPTTRPIRRTKTVGGRVLALSQPQARKIALRMAVPFWFNEGLPLFFGCLAERNPTPPIFSILGAAMIAGGVACVQEGFKVDEERFEFGDGV